MDTIPAFPSTFHIDSGKYAGGYRQLIPKSEIDARRLQLARNIVNNLPKTPHSLPPLILSLGHGAIKFGPDIGTDIAQFGIEHGIDPEFDTLHISGGGKEGAHRLHKVPSVNPEGRNVIIAEDIADSGNTLRFVTRMIQAQKPASLAIACLLVRPESARLLTPASRLIQTAYGPSFYTEAHPTVITYPGFIIRCGFVAGYGMDIAPNGKRRMWPNIYARYTDNHPHEYALAG